MTEEIIEKLESCLLNFVQGKNSIYITFNRLKNTFFDLTRMIERETMIHKDRDYLFERIYQYILKDPNYESNLANTAKLERENIPLLPLSIKIYDHITKKIDNLSEQDNVVINKLYHINVYEPVTEEDLQLLDAVSDIFNLELEPTKGSVRGMFQLLQNRLYLENVNSLFRFLGYTEGDLPLAHTRKTVPTKNVDLGTAEIALYYYIYFRSRGFTSSQIYDWFGKVLYVVKKRYSTDENMSEVSKFSNYVSSEDEWNEFNLFTNALFCKVRSKRETGEDQIRKYIQTSASKSTVFNSKDGDTIDTAKLKAYWTNFTNLNIEYETSAMTREFNDFHSDPTNYLKRD